MFPFLAFLVALCSFYVHQQATDSVCLPFGARQLMHCGFTMNNSLLKAKVPADLNSLVRLIQHGEVVCHNSETIICKVLQSLVRLINGFVTTTRNHYHIAKSHLILW